MSKPPRFNHPSTTRRQFGSLGLAAAAGLASTPLLAQPAAFSAYTFALVVPESSPWKTWQEFAAYAKASPDKVNFGTTGVGSSGHVAIHMLGKKIGVDFNTVPFKGGAEVLQAFVGGHINAVIDGGWAQVERQGALH